MTVETVKKTRKNITAKGKKVESPELLAAQIKMSAANLKQLEEMYTNIESRFNSAKNAHDKLLAKQKQRSGSDSASKLVQFFEDQGIELKKTVKKGNVIYILPSEKFTKVELKAVDGKVIATSYKDKVADSPKTYKILLPAILRLLKAFS